MSGNLRQEFNERAMENLEVTNKLLLDMVKNQRQALKSLTKIFIIAISCYTFLVIAMVVGFFIYESQFDIVQGQYETYEYNQEAEKNKMQACYYKTIIEAMENSDYGEDYNWAGPDEDRMGYPRGRDSMGRFTSRRGYDGMRNQRGYDQRMMDYESGRMGYSNGAYDGSQRGMSSNSGRNSRYGYSHDEYMEKKSALNQNDPKRMKMIEDHMDDLYGMFKEEVQDMSPEEKQMWKTKLNKIINM